MNHNEREESQPQRKCVNCGQPIYQTPDPNNIYWYHRKTGSAVCAGLTAMPEPTASPTQDGLTVESLRSELRQLFPDVQIIVDIRDCGTETQTLRGTTLEYGAQIGMNGNEFVGDSPAQVLAAVRAWKAKGGVK